MSIKIRKEKKGNKNMGISIEHDTNNTCENGGTCVRIWRPGEGAHMFTHTYTGFTIRDMHVEKVDRHTSRVMRITTVPHQRYVLNSQEK